MDCGTGALPWRDYTDNMPLSTLLHRNQSMTRSTLQRDLTADEVAHFREHGWVFAPGLIEPETALRLAPEADRMLRASNYSSVTGLVDKAFKQHHDPRHDVPLTREIALCAGAARNCARLFRGAPRARLLQSNFVAKFGVGDEHENDVTMYHQDFPGHAIDRSEMATVWIALGTISPEMGALRFVDGSHRYGALGRSFVRENDDLLRVQPWLNELTLTPAHAMRPGDATIHHGLTVHGAPKNATRDPRLAYQLIYIDSEALYDGAKLNKRWDALGLELHKPLDHPQFPMVPLD